MPPNLRLLLVGCPGSGKGTQTSRLTRTHQTLTAISSGDLLRRRAAQAKSDVDASPSVKKTNEMVAEMLGHGTLVPDVLVSRLVLDEVDRLGSDAGWILDGQATREAEAKWVSPSRFPRTLGQARQLDLDLAKRKQPLAMVVYLDVPESVILERVTARWIHAPSGRTYNLSYNPPKFPGKDDVTGEPLTQRSDDTAETVSARLRSFHEQTLPILAHYGDLVKRFKGRTSDEIYPQIEAALAEWVRKREAWR
ncbi:hypothetical protein BJ742DRAFT_767332 [Cladochytrium replicatum]|nr:hypothetical protein BJ742DRAFT_767332 [Cladochytrium replicatum]